MKVSTMLIIVISFFAVTGNTFAATAAKQDVCHNGKTINISKNAVDAHVRHGDWRRDCEDVPQAVALFRCGGPDITILSVSLSAYVPSGRPIVVDSSCSDSIMYLRNSGYKKIHSESVVVPADAENPANIVTDYAFSGPRSLMPQQTP